MKPIPRPNEGAPLVLGQFLPYRLSLLSNTVASALSRLYAIPFHLSIAEWRALAMLGEAAPRTAAEICVRTAMDKVRVSRAVHGLDRHGLIERETDPGDRRRILLRLNARGLYVYNSIVPQAMAREADLLDALTPEETAQLEIILDKLQDRAERQMSEIRGQSSTFEDSRTED